jgi:predicted secreted protein
MKLRLFIALIPAILRAFGLTRETWDKAIDAVRQVQAEYLTACTDAEIAGKPCTYNRLSEWRERMGREILGQMSASEFWLNVVRELAVLVSRWKNGALVLVALLILPACTVIHGDQSKGTYTLATLGGDVSEMAQTPGGYTVAKVDNGTAFRETSSALKNYIWAGALKSVANTAGNTFKSVTRTKEATKTVGLQERGLTDRTGIAAEVEQTKILNPEPLP